MMADDGKQQMYSMVVEARKRLDEEKAAMKEAVNDWKSASKEDKGVYKELMDNAQAAYARAQDAYKEIASRTLELETAKVNFANRNQEEPVSERLVEWWALVRITSADQLLRNKFVELPEAITGRQDQRVYMRECYTNILRALISNPVSRCGVYGTPGVGKSVFAALLVAMLGVCCPKSIIIFRSRQIGIGNKKAYAFMPDQSVNIIPEDRVVTRFQSVLNPDDGSPAVWVIDDDGLEPMHHASGSNLCHIVVSSANLERKMGLKEVDKGAQRRYLVPPLELGEMFAVAEARGTDVNVGSDTRRRLIDFYTVYGGSARMCFSEDANPLLWLESMIPPNIDSNRLKFIMQDTLEGSGSEHENGASRILHLYYGCDRNTGLPSLLYAYRRARFASVVVANRMVDSLFKLMRRETEADLHRALVHGDSAHSQFIFEPVMHGFLRKGGTFVDVQQQQQVFSVNLSFNNVASVVDANGFGCVHTAACGTYNQPIAKNFVCVDSFAKLPDGQVLLFQMTISGDHAPKMQGMLDLFRVPVGTPDALAYENGTKAVLVPANTMLVFIIPRAKIPEFAIPQKYKGTDGKVHNFGSNPGKYIRERIGQMKIAPILDDAVPIVTHDECAINHDYT